MIKTVDIAKDNNNTSDNNNPLGETLSSPKIVRIKSPIPKINMSGDKDKDVVLTIDDDKNEDAALTIDNDKEKDPALTIDNDKEKDAALTIEDLGTKENDEKSTSKAAVIPTEVVKNKSMGKIGLKTLAKSSIAAKKLSKTFKTFRSSNNLASSEKKLKFSASSVVKRDPNMTDEEAEADALVRTVIKTRRMKKILKAKLDSLRVQENIQFAIEHNLDAGELNSARADIETACTRLTARFEKETGPLVNALNKVRRLHQDMQLIEDLESAGFRNVVEMLETQLNDLVDERNSKQYQIQYAHKILHEIEEDEEAAEELLKNNLLNEKKTEHQEEGNFLNLMRAAREKHKHDLLEEQEQQDGQDVPTKEDDGDVIAETRLDDDDGFKIVTPKASRRMLAGLT